MTSGTELVMSESLLKQLCLIPRCYIDTQLTLVLAVAI